jgi:hypothetical protein
VAAFASVASTSHDPAERLRDALRALPKGDKQQLPYAPSVEVPALLGNGKAREWAAAAQARHVEIVNMRPEPDVTSLEENSWATWRDRFQQYRRGGRRRFDLNEEDLLLRTRRAGPLALFRHELGQMTLREWTEALLAATRRTEERSTVEIPDWVRPEVETELISGRQTLLVILGESVTSPTAQWLPSKRHGALWVEHTRWFEYYDVLRLGEPETPWYAAARRYLVVEVSGDPETLAQAVLRKEPFEAFAPSPPFEAVAPSPRSLPQFAYLGKDKLPTHVTPVVPYLENVKSVDETVARLDLMGRSGRPPA